MLAMTSRLCSYILLVSFLILTHTRVEARDIHVNNRGGNDYWTGAVSSLTSGLGPVQTISRALELASQGDRVVLANTGMPYRETLSLSAAKHCGIPGQPFVIEGNGAILDGSRPVPPTAWEFHRDNTFCVKPPRLGYQQLFLNGRPPKRIQLEPNATEVPKLEPLQWCIFHGKIYFAVENERTPHDYDLTCAYLPVGITLYHVHDVAIANLKVQGFQIDGVNAHDGTRDCILSEVVSRGNGRSGVCIAGCSKLQMFDCVVGDNGTAQVYTEALGAVSIHGGDVLENTAPAFVREGGRIFVDGQPRE
jgi:hypothetical protein